MPADKQGPVRNNAGGHANHSLFWTILGPNGGGASVGDLASAIDSTFGGLDALKQQLRQTPASTASDPAGHGWWWRTATSR